MTCGGCCGSPDPSDVRVTIVDSQAWNNAMPGSRPSFHVVLSCRIDHVGLGEDSCLSASAEMLDGTSGLHLGHFPMIMQSETGDGSLAILRPERPWIGILRSAPGLPPVDTTRTPLLRFRVKIETRTHGSVIRESEAIHVFTAQ